MIPTVLWMLGFVCLVGWLVGWFCFFGFWFLTKKLSLLAFLPILRKILVFFIFLENHPFNLRFSNYEVFPAPSKSPLWSEVPLQHGPSKPSPPDCSVAFSLCHWRPAHQPMLLPHSNSLQFAVSVFAPAFIPAGVSPAGSYSWCKPTRHSKSNSNVNLLAEQEQSFLISVFSWPFAHTASHRTPPIVS